MINIDYKKNIYINLHLPFTAFFADIKLLRMQLSNALNLPIS